MSGVVALHGGAEFLPGDEPFLRALLVAARHAAGSDPVRALVVPTAAARQQPERAARHGVDALRRVADHDRVALDAGTALVVDPASASDAALVERLRSAHLIHLPGGDPDLVPATLAGTPAWDAIRSASQGGAVLAGASAGAMGLSTPTWTPAGFREGLGLVGPFVVVPHFERYDARGRDADIAWVAEQRLPALGLDEQTGVLREPDGWRVVGPGRAVWLPPGGAPIVARDGETLPAPV